LKRAGHRLVKQEARESLTLAGFLMVVGGFRLSKNAFCLEDDELRGRITEPIAVATGLLDSTYVVRSNKILNHYKRVVPNRSSNKSSRSIGLLCYPTDNEADAECECEKEEDRA
jgi:hypothetical protein